VIWGGYHGALLSLERLFRGNRPMRDEWSWLYPVQAIGTFGLVLIGWVFFRAADLPQSLQVLGQMFSRPGGHTLLQHWHVGLAAVALALAVGKRSSNGSSGSSKGRRGRTPLRWRRCSSAWKSSG
jgi:D-alanyl-lipoteichoic acid acyltransferase DltB (MBOAT superfamily)